MENHENNNYVIKLNTNLNSWEKMFGVFKKNK